jgi:hypothetical protein
VKDQYFGDINDYRKYGLVRAIHAASEMGSEPGALGEAALPSRSHSHHSRRRRASAPFVVNLSRPIPLCALCGGKSCSIL